MNYLNSNTFLLVINDLSTFSYIDFESAESKIRSNKVSVNVNDVVVFQRTIERDIVYLEIIDSNCQKIFIRWSTLGHNTMAEINEYFKIIEIENDK